MRLRDQDPRELSVYLAQHRENPIDWYEWGPEAWEKAVELDVPVLVSIGYSSCHWCHVMAHESFEDPTVGAFVNERFVSIKVDREERPDVDAVYMDAVQASTGRGGWPMTVFCTPDGRPFFAGTYFGRRTDGHRIGFEDLCRHLDELWRERRAEIMERADALTEAIADGDELPEPLYSGSGDSSSRVDTMSLVDTMIDGLESQVDVQHGGFGRPPKFPHAAAIDALLRHHRRTGDRRSRDLALLTLNAMASGGIFDHLGGGFARYSTDDRWLVPHFEKMLPDQALLARVYLHAWQSTGDPHWHRIMSETIGYVRRDLGHALGGFHSAEDADTEGVEGRYYVWTPDEIRIACGPDAEAVIDWFGVTETGNWEGTTVLNRIGQPPRERPPAVERGCRALLAARTRRVRPGVDTKIVTEWNALMIATLAEAGAAAAEPDWVNAGVAAGEFLCRSLRRPDGRWLRSWQPAGEGARGRPGAPAFAADLAALVDAFVRLHEATGDARWLTEAVTTAEQLLDLFGDDQEAGLFTTGRDGDRLITRPKEWIEGAQPSANSLAAVALLRLAALTGDERWSIPARAIVDRVSGAATRAPLGFAHLLWALELDSFPVTEIVITGDRPDLVAAVHERWNPSAVLTWGSPQDSPLWWGRNERGAQGRAYVCRDHVCERPVDTVSALQAQLTT